MANNETLLDEPALWLPSNLDAAGDPLPGEPQYTPRVDRRLIEALITDGVFDVFFGQLKVRQRAAGANMSVEIDPGFAGVLADGQAYAGRYLAVANAVQTLQIDDAPASGSRIDLIVVRVHDSSVTGTRNEAVFEAVKGTTDAGGNPTVPVLPDSSLPLAEILVTATVAGQPRVSITNADITDRRAQARVPLGVTQTGVPADWPPTRVPADWPDGITTLPVLAANGWPADGVLVTTKNATFADAGQRAVQHLTSSEGTGVVYAFRRSLSGSPWTWSSWSAVPSTPREHYETAQGTRSTLNWSDSFTGSPRINAMTTGPRGIALVTIGARVSATGPSLRAYIGFSVYNQSQTKIIGPTPDNAFGIEGGPDNLKITGSRNVKVDLQPFTTYDFVSQFHNGGGVATFDHRKILVETR